MEKNTTYVLEMHEIEKRFTGVRALSQVNFALEKGEIHALVGANGAGKSTLMKVLAGIYPDYQGTIVLDGQTVAVIDPAQALKLGISVIYQEFHLVPQLTVAENIVLGREPRRTVGGVPFLDWAVLRQEARSILTELNFNLPLDAQVAALGVADQQLVQIAKAMASRAKILVMDEPTARLSRNERDNLFIIMRRLKENGVSIVYISHFLEEVFMIADRVSVLRDGKNVATLRTADLNRGQLVKMMLGREVVADNFKRRHSLGEVLLRVENLSNRQAGAAQFTDITFSLRAGEILGIAGLVGSGRTELARTLFGADDARGRGKNIEGRIEVGNRPYRVQSPQAAIARGVALAPEDRKQQGLVLVRPVEDNILLTVTRTLRRGPFMHLKARRRVVADMIERLKIKCSNTQVLVNTLSGGNQQKVVLAKWLATQSHILILDQPTAGIDVGTKEEIYHLLCQLAETGVGLIVISDDPEEMSRICERVLIMRKGRIVKELSDYPSSEEVLAGITAEY